MTAALEGCEWSAALPDRTLPPGKTRYPVYRRLGGPQGRSGQAENFAPPGFDLRTVQPVASRYTDWATRPIPNIVPPEETDLSVMLLPAKLLGTLMEATSRKTVNKKRVKKINSHLLYLETIQYILYNWCIKNIVNLTEFNRTIP